MKKIFLKSVLVTIAIVVVCHWAFPDKAPSPMTADEYVNYLIQKEQQQKIQKAKDNGLTPVYIVNP